MTQKTWNKSPETGLVTPSLKENNQVLHVGMYESWFKMLCLSKDINVRHIDVKKLFLIHKHESKSTRTWGFGVFISSPG